MGRDLGNSEALEKEHLVEHKSQETNDNDSSNRQETGFNVYYKALAFVSAFLYVGCIILSGICVQLLERSIPDFELNFIRCLTGFIVFSGYFILIMLRPLVGRSAILVTVTYGTVVTTCSLCAFISMAFIPLTSYQSMETTSFIALSMFLLALFAQEHISIQNIISTITCVTGVFMILQPEFMFEGSEEHGELLAIFMYRSLQFCICVFPQGSGWHFDVHMLMKLQGMGQSNGIFFWGGGVVE